MNKYGKIVVMVLATVASAIVAALTGDNNVSPVEWSNIGILAGGALTTYVVPNIDVGIAKYAKGVVAFLTAAVTLWQVVGADGVTLSEWLQFGVAGLAAVGVPFVAGPLWEVTRRTVSGIPVNELRPE